MQFGFVLTDLSGGGAEKAIINIADNLVKKGHTVHIVIFRDKCEYTCPVGVILHVLSEKPSFGWLGKRVLARKLSKKIKQIEQEHKFDVIVSTLPFADEVAVMAKLPHHWCRIANTLSSEINRLRESNAAKANRRFTKYQQVYQNRKLITVSRGVKEDMQSYFHLNDTTINVIHNPFDFDKIQQLSQQKIETIESPYIIHVGRFSAQKRHDVLLDAFATMRQQVKLVLLVNDNPKLREMIQVRGLEDKVIIAGFQSNPYPWIANAQLLVLSSEHEGMPNVIIESLIIGTPVVSTDCPSGPRDILERHYSQYLAAVNQPAALAVAIDKALAEGVDMRQVDLAPYQLGHSIDAYESLKSVR